MQNSILNKIQNTIIPMQSNAMKYGHRLTVTIKASPELLNFVGENCTQWHKSSVFISDTNTLKANDIIGQEFDLVAFHLNNSFDPNLMAAISGTVKAGGIFLLLIPNSGTNKTTAFYHHLISEIENENQFLKIEINNEKIDVNTPQNNSFTLKDDDPFSQQKSAIELIKKVLTGHRNRPLTLCANRGRGKSAAIGIAIGQLLLRENSKTITVYITAPSLASASIIFKHIKLTLPYAKSNTGQISFKDNFIKFIAPDKLLSTLPSCDFLIVDEAAAFNPHSLESLLKHYSRIVFSTTLHGYEGSGYGFINRFSKKLNTITPEWKSVTLNQPIRWKKNDPLEAFVDKVFMLSINENKSDFDFSLNEINVRIISSENLRTDKKLLESIFSLLKAAHYKTSPNDLQQLLNSENSIIFLSYCKNDLLAAAVTEKEGSLPEDLAQEIYKGNRRPKGEFIPQSIIMHLGLIEAAQLNYLRIMRIAVYPELQGKKIGTNLLENIINYANESKFDFIGCSFGATAQLLRFWQKFEFHTFRIGYKKNNFSGCNAALIMKPISERTTTLTQTADKLFFTNFIAQLSASHKNLDADIVTQILLNYTKVESDTKLPDKTLNDIISFTKHNRSYDDNLSSIKTFLLHANSFEILNDMQSKLVITKALQNHDWIEVGKRLGLKGKNQGLAEFKRALSKILEVHY